MATNPRIYRINSNDEEARTAILLTEYFESNTYTRAHACVGEFQSTLVIFYGDVYVWLLNYLF